MSGRLSRRDADAVSHLSVRPFGLSPSHRRYTPSMSLEVSKTTASLMPLSAQLRFLFKISLTSSLSLSRSIFSFSSGPISISSLLGAVPSSFDSPNSYRRRTRTNTLGMSSLCLRIHMGAMMPSGYSGDVGEKGDIGECEPIWLFGRRAFRGGKRMLYSSRRGDPVSAHLKAMRSQECLLARRTLSTKET